MVVDAPVPGTTAAVAVLPPPVHHDAPTGDVPAVAGRGLLTVDVPLGRRVLVVGDLLLQPDGGPSATALAADLVQTLERWQGPGVVVVCGNLFDGPAAGLDVDVVHRTLAAHGPLARAIAAFTARPDCRLLVLPGWRDPEVRSDAAVRAELATLGAEVAPALDLRLTTAAGERRVVVRPGAPTDPAVPIAEHRPAETRSWLTGLDRLEDPGASSRFVTSRLLYRRLRHIVWVPPVLAVVVAVVLHVTQVFHGLQHLAHTPRASGALNHAYAASWPHRLLFVLFVVAVFEIALAVGIAVASRRIWRREGGGELPSPWPHPLAASLGGTPAPGELAIGDHPALDEARALLASGTTGLITGGSFRAEFTHLDRGFFACAGGTTEFVREHSGRVGLPPVFLPHRQVSWIELETGAELHVRLLLADVSLPTSTFLERFVSDDQIVKGYRVAALHPALVASWPHGAAWPPAPEVAADRVQVRRVRRLAASAIFVAGLVDLLIAVTPPLRDRLHLVEQVLPLGVAQAAGALVALAGIGLMMLARGVLRGQRRAWLVSLVLLSVSLGLHLAHGPDLDGMVLSALVLVFLIVERRRFAAATDTGSLRSAVTTLIVGGVVATGAATITVEVSGRVRHHPLPGWVEVAFGSAERLVGVQTVAFPPAINGFLAPSLLAVGMALIIVALFLVTRPVVDRRLSSVRAATARRAAESRARDLVRRHGTGTLDYFALRDDKQWFFHRDSLVAYAVYAGVCLVSPDPIGPPSERRQVWNAFRHYVDANGWAVGVMGAGDDWLPLYRDAGMRHVYIGDEAVVDVQSFSLAGGRMKGLRQACRARRPQRLHGRVPRPDDGVTGAGGPPGRPDGPEPPHRPRTRLLDDARPGVRPARHRLAAHRGQRPRGRAGRRVPVRPVRGHRGLLARPHAARPGRASQWPLGLRPVLDHRAPPGRGQAGPEPQLRRHAQHPRRGAGRRCGPAGRALGPAATVGRPAHRDPVEVQRQVRARVAPPLRGLRLGRAVHPDGDADPPGRVADRDAGRRPAARHHHPSPARPRDTRPGRAAAQRATDRLDCRLIQPAAVPPADGPTADGPTADGPTADR